MDPSELKALTDEALGAMREGQDVRAVAIADQLIAAAPDDPIARAIRAQALLKSDAGTEALNEARRAVQLDPESEHAQTILGIAAWRAGKLALAQQSLQRAIDLSGRRPGLLVDYAWFMASQRGPKLAEKAASEAVEAAADCSTAWAALGLVQFRLHRRREAEDSLRRALQLDPGDPYAQSVMVTLLQDKRQDKKAVALAHLLEETPGTEEFVENVRQEAKRRQVEKALVERNAFPDVVYELPIRRRFWISLAVLMTVLLWLALQPDSAGAFFLAIVMPLVILWLAYRIFR